MMTPGTATIAGDNLDMLMDAYPPTRLKAILDPEDVTGTVKFLISDDSAQMTGQILTTDAGMTTL